MHRAYLFNGSANSIIVACPFYVFSAYLSTIFLILYTQVLPPLF